MWLASVPQGEEWEICLEACWKCALPALEAFISSRIVRKDGEVSVRWLPASVSAAVAARGSAWPRVFGDFSAGLVLRGKKKKKEMEKKKKADCPG